MADLLISLEGVWRTYVRRERRSRLRRSRVEVHALVDLDLQVVEGSFVGYAGPNGAGKSTTIKLLTGILSPTRGVVRVDRLEPVRQRVELVRRLGVVFGQRSQLWWDLPLRESFDIAQAIYGIPMDDYRRRLGQVVELLELGPQLEAPVRQLSLGQRMRGDLAAALLHGPKLLLLDEPTIGLDVVSKARIRDFLRDLNREQGTTIILTTHDMRDIERLCSRLLILDRGSLVYDGTVERIKEIEGAERTLVVDLAESTPPLQLDKARVLKVEGPRQWIGFRKTEVSAAALIVRISAAHQLLDVSIHEPDIEEILRRLYSARSAEVPDSGQAPVYRER